MYVTIEIPEDRAAHIQARADACGMTVDRWLLKLAEQNAPAPAAVSTPPERPIWEVITEIMSDVPDDEFQKLPADAASQIDHYLYGHSKR